MKKKPTQDDGFDKKNTCSNFNIKKYREDEVWSCDLPEVTTQ